MTIYRTEATIPEDRRLTIDELPFEAGDRVEILVRSQPHTATGDRQYPLRGLPLRYDAPFGSVADSDWEALQ